MLQLRVSMNRTGGCANKTGDGVAERGCGVILQSLTARLHYCAAIAFEGGGIN